MGRLTQDGTGEPISRDQILRLERRQDSYNTVLFSPVQLTTSRIANLTRLIYTLAVCDDYTCTIHTYIHIAGTFNMPLHSNSGYGKERRIITGSWRPAKAALVRNYLEVYKPCAGGLPAVNAIGTQIMRDPINSGLTRWRMAVLNK